MFTSICPICDKRFTSPTQRRFCSIRCRNINNARTRTAKRIETVCPICDKTFTTSPNPSGRPRHICCSVKCGHISAACKRKVLRVEHICPICGKVFSDRPSRDRTYCSRDCMYEARKRTGKRLICMCDYCGKEFITPDASNWATHNQQRFCSETCKGKGIAKERGLHIRKKVVFVCKHCGKSFTRRARVDRKYLYCSRECFWEHHRGPNHWQWQGGTDRYYGPNWEEQRIAALERDGYCCCHCGSDDRPNAHHIFFRSEFDQDWIAMNDLSNLITLCPSCHTNLHLHPTENWCAEVLQR